MCVLFWRPRTDPGKEAMKPTRLVAGKFSLRCYLPLLLLHISSKETRSVQSWLHNPRKEKTRGARSRREDEEKGNQGRKNRRTGPRQSHCSSFARVTLHTSSEEGKYTQKRKEEEPKSLWSHGSVRGRNPSSRSSVAKTCLLRFVSRVLDLPALLFGELFASL